ncbi:uncharacterized protein LOC116425374 [Nomia melanderi]|uniref:uncharacterized protein LOC116425374 n=1 Tax=Nomia melanderi TaxID=2448451 RepID=UPI00130419DA|nr:uncharacterized protein LOC116425374 [Nomia melanderi]
MEICHRMLLRQGNQRNSVIENMNPGINVEVISTDNISVRNPSTSLDSNCNGNPPSYEEAVNPNVPPPPYNVLFGPVNQTPANVSTFKELLSDYGKNCCLLLLGTFGCIICIGLRLSIPICKIVIGSFYSHDCPQEEYIPIYLLVSGSVGIFIYFLESL